MSVDLQTLPALMDLAFQEDDEEYPVAVNMVYQIDSVIRTLQKSSTSAKNVTPSPAIGLDTNGLSKTTDPGRARVDMDEIHFRSLLVETQVTSTVNYLKWRWDIIIDIIEGPLVNPRRLEDAIKGTKFLKRLIGFYRPFKYRFSDARNTKANQRYVRIGCALLKSLLQTPEGVQYLSESKLLRQLAECLAQLDRVGFLTGVMCDLILVEESLKPLFIGFPIINTNTIFLDEWLDIYSSSFRPRSHIRDVEWRVLYHARSFEWRSSRFDHDRTLADDQHVLPYY